MRLGNRICVMLLAAAVVAWAGASMATTIFSDDFNDGVLDPAWVPNIADNPGGHLGEAGGFYGMTDAWGNPGAKLQRFDTSEAYQAQYTHSIDVLINPLLLTGGGGTKTDFKWKTFGPDGFMEVILNSFGDMRLWHNDSDGGAGNIQPNTRIDFSDGDVLSLQTVYDQGTDTVTVTYGLNAAPTMPFYSGGGIDGPIGDLISNFVEVEVFKWNNDPTTQANVLIDNWSLDAIPEPGMLALLGLGGLALMVSRRRK